MKVEAVKPFAAGTVTRAALKPLAELIGPSRKFLDANSIGLFPKGRRAERRIARGRNALAIAGSNGFPA